MLAKYWKLRMVNKTDQTITYNNDARIVIRMAAWKLGTNGALSYATLTDDLGFSTGENIAADVEVESAASYNNTSNLYYGIKGTFEVKADVTSTDGSFDLYLEESEDDTQWPSDQADFDITLHMRLIASLTVSTDAIDEDAAVNFEF